MKLYLKEKANDPSTSQKILSKVTVTRLKKPSHLVLKSELFSDGNRQTRSHSQVLVFATWLPNPRGKEGNKNWWLQDQTKQIQPRSKDCFWKSILAQETGIYSAQSHCLYDDLFLHKSSHLALWSQATGKKNILDTISLSLLSFFSCQFSQYHFVSFQQLFCPIAQCTALLSVLSCSFKASSWKIRMHCPYTLCAQSGSIQAENIFSPSNSNVSQPSVRSKY